MSDQPGPGPNPYSSPTAPMMESTGSAIHSKKTLEMLRQTRPWVIFMSILGFLLSAMMALAGACMGVSGVLASAGTDSIASGTLGAVMAIINILVGIFYFVPSYHLFRYGNEIGRFIQSNQQHQLDGALEAQKSFWRFVGIVTAAVMTMYLLMIAVMFVLMLFGLGAAASMD